MTTRIDQNMPLKAVYGFEPTLSPFEHHTPREQARLLRRWGANTVFGGYTNPAFVDAIHAEGLQICAEFACFQGQQWWESHPNSRPTLANGELLDPVDWYHGVNPTIPAVRDALLEKLAALLRNHELDGVWLDFIRWPCRWESPHPTLPQTSFDPQTLARFAADVGLSTPPTRTELIADHDYTNAWSAWRIDQITAWVAAARAVIDAIRPAATLGLFGIPWRTSDLEGAIHSTIGQDFAALAPHVDIFSPMTYHHMCGQSVAWIGDVSVAIAQQTQKPVCPVIQAVNHPTALPTHEYAKALDVAQATADGVIIFTLSGLFSDDKLAATTTAWQS